jgi:hypothetical protein
MLKRFLELCYPLHRDGGCVEETIHLQNIERAVDAILALYAVDAPPIPVEVMLQSPKPNTWEKADISHLSNSINLRTSRHALRLSVARLLAREVSDSAWGATWRLSDIATNAEGLRKLARAIIMPRPMIEAISLDVRTAQVIGMRFRVPEEDAQLRLNDLNILADAEFSAR